MKVLQEGHPGHSEKTDWNGQNLGRKSGGWHYQVSGEGLLQGRAGKHEQRHHGVRFRSNLTTFILEAQPSSLQ